MPIPVNDDGGVVGGFRRLSSPEEERESASASSDSYSCSSIGKNSDDDDDGESSEVQSCRKFDEDGSFDSIRALEEALPIRRGISIFYDGKSKSFTSLADASTSYCVKDIAKPENAYTRKRRNQLASALVCSDKNRGFQLRNNRVGKISKRPTNTSRTTTLAFAVAMSSDASCNMTQGTNLNKQVRQSTFKGPSPFRPNLSALRSFSMADLHQCTGLANCTFSPSEKSCIQFS